MRVRVRVGVRVAEDLGVVKMVRGLEADVAHHSPDREAMHVLEVGAAKLRRAAPPEGSEQPRGEGPVSETR